ncbi:MAG: hypothetical protein QM820_18220 [Minicystis sp.]
MKAYVVRQGDYLKQLAHALGFDADAVWNDPKNAELSQRRDPNLLHPVEYKRTSATEEDVKALLAAIRLGFR